MATSFNINKKAISETATLHLVDPITEEKLYADEAEKFPLQIVLKGKASKEYISSLATVKRKTDARGKSDFKQQMADNNELLALVSVEALNFDLGDGVPIKTKEQFTALYSSLDLYWVRDQVSDFLGAKDSFSIK